VLIRKKEEPGKPKKAPESDDSFVSEEISITESEEESESQTEQDESQSPSNTTENNPSTIKSIEGGDVVAGDEYAYNDEGDDDEDDFGRTTNGQTK